MSAFLSLTEQQKKALFAALSRKDVFTILSTGHGKYIIFQSLPDVCKYLSLRGYSYPRHAIILVVCPLKSLVDSHIRELRNRGVSATSLSSPDVDDRISCLDVFTIFCYNTVIPLNELTCLGQQNINLRIRNESFLAGKKTYNFVQVLNYFRCSLLFPATPNIYL